MDRYDKETLKQITTQFPKEPSIQFLVRMIRVCLTKIGTLKSELDDTQSNLRLAMKGRKFQVENNEIQKLAKIESTKEENYRQVTKVNGILNKENKELKREVHGLKMELKKLRNKGGNSHTR